MRVPHPLLRTLLAVALLPLSAFSAHAQGSFDIAAVARTGDPVSAPATLVRASAPQLSDAGEVLFLGDGGLLIGRRVCRTRCRARSQDRFMVVAAPGDRGPDDRPILAIGAASFNDAGQVAFSATLGPSPAGAPAGNALLLFSDGTITPIVQSGDAAPGGGTFTAFRALALNIHGHIAFEATVQGGPFLQLMVYADGAITTLARDRDPAPGGGRFNAFTAIRMTDAGHVVFESSFFEFSGRGVFTVWQGEITAIARPGSTAPDGGTFVTAVQPSVNAQGHIAFRAEVSAPSGSGIFVFSEGTMTQVVRDGDVLDAGALTRSSAPSIDARGRVAFQAEVGDPSRPAIFLWRRGVVRLVAGAGIVTRAGEVLESATAPWFNSRGQLVFADTVASLGRVYLASGRRIVRVAGEGDVVPVTPRFVTASTSAVRTVGQPVFVASIFPGVMGVFDGDGALRVRVGDMTTRGGVVGSISDVASNTAGTLAFSGQPSTGGTGLFLLREGTLSELVRPGDEAPDGGTFIGAFTPSVNASDRVVFGGRTSVSAGRPGLFVASDAVITQLAFEPPGGFTNPGSPAINDADQIVFANNAPDGGSSLWVWEREQLSGIATSFTAAPGGGAFYTFGPQQLDAAGRVAFLASMGPIPAPAIFSFAAGEGFRRIARTGDPAPGGDTLGASQNLSVDAHGRIALSNFLVGTTGSSALLFDNGALEIIARTGDPAPEGDTFASVTNPKIGADGRIFFTATLSTGISGVFVAARPAAQEPYLDTQDAPEN